MNARVTCETALCDYQRQRDYRTDRQGRKHIEQSDPYEPLCFAVDTKTINFKEKPVAR